MWRAATHLYSSPWILQKQASESSVSFGPKNHWWMHKWSLLKNRWMKLCWVWISINVCAAVFILSFPMRGRNTWNPVESKILLIQCHCYLLSPPHCVIVCKCGHSINTCTKVIQYCVNRKCNSRAGRDHEKANGIDRPCAEKEQQVKLPMKQTMAPTGSPRTNISTFLMMVLETSLAEVWVLFSNGMIRKHGLFLFLLSAESSLSIQWKE